MVKHWLHISKANLNSVIFSSIYCFIWESVTLKEHLKDGQLTVLSGTREIGNI